ncbi:MAG: AMIN domain-containing protein [Leptolyngbyaceae cyanobacterium]
MRPRSRRKPKSSFWQWSGSGAAAIAGVMVTAAIVAPVRAAVLNTWSFDPDTRQLAVTLPEGVTPNFFLLAEPARIVVDMPGTTLGSIPLEQEYAGAVRSIRFSEILGGSRVVVELAPDTLLDPRHAELVSTDAGNGLTQWILQPLIQDGASVAPIAAVEPDVSTSAVTTPPEAPAEPETLPAQSVGVSPEPVEESTEDATVEPSTDFAIADETVEAPADEPESVPADEPTIPDLPPTPSAASDTASELSAVSAEPTPDTTAPETLAEEPSEPIRVTLPEEPEVTIPEVPESPVDEVSEPDPTQPLPPSPSSLATEEPSSPPSTTETAPAAEAEAAPTVPTIPARPLPSGPDPLRNIRTDASVLAGVGSEEPSEQLPSNGLPTTAQPSVSVPPLNDRNSSSSPQVSVPSIANVPAPPLPTPADTAPAEAVAPPVQPTAETDASSAIAVAVPEPPSSPAPATPAPATAISNSPANEIRPPQAGINSSVPTTSATEPSPEELRPPTLANVVEPALETPPFLSSTEDIPSSEQPSIPSPPTSSSSRIVPFGTPLPVQDKTIEEAVLPPGIETIGTIPVGTQLVLQYPGTEPLTLTQSEPWYEVLILAEDVLHPTTNERLLLKGTQVIGRFEGFDGNERRFVSQVFVEAGGDRRALLAESDWLAGVAQPDGNSLLTNSGIGAAALTVLSGFSGVGLLGGAALGAASSFATAPRIVTIEPGQLIRVEVVSDTALSQNVSNATP